MVFVREKQIKGKPYAYLVENIWKNGNAQQSVKEYLGRVHPIPKTPPPRSLDAEPQELIMALIAQEIQGAPVDVRIDWAKKTVTSGKRAVVLSLNGGHLCTHTLRELLKALHVRNEETPGSALADAFSRAGLRIPQQDFVRLYLHHHGGAQ